MRPIKQSIVLAVSITALLFLDGCSTQTKFTTSFGKRHYNKGFYWDMPGNIKPAVAIAAAPMPNKKTLQKLEAPVTAKAIEQNNPERIDIATPVLIKKPENKIAQLVINAITPKHVKDLPPTTSSANTYNPDIGKDTGKGIFSLSGFVLCIAGLCLFIFGSDAGIMLVIAILVDVAGVLLSIYAVAVIDKYDAFAMIGLGLNALILGLTFAVTL